jgi:hydroxypyruvate isomerase
MNFCANLSLLFRDVPFLGRFERAARAGFDAVEFWWPADVDLAAVQAAVADAGLTVALFNLDAGDMAAGDRGLPGRDRREHVTLAVQNLRWASQQAAAIGAKILVEAVNTIENGPYLISRTADAAELIERVGEPNVALQYDVYHMQRMEGNLAATIRRHAERIAHVQIADSPGRGEPGTGEINFAYLFGVLAEVGYRGHVGLEYVPTTATTEESLRWMPALAR